MFKKIILSTILLGSIFASEKQKVILITGTAHGIGKSTAQYLICLLYTSPSPRD